MEMLEVMKARHSVRQYTNKEIPVNIRKQLLDKVGQLNQESGLHMQLFFDEPECFDSAKAHYGKFSGVRNYLSIVGKKDANLDEKSGYYGEQIVLLAQSLGINSCWVGLTHGKSHAYIGKGEKQSVVIALGYGENQGVSHKTKDIDALCSVKEDMPDWLKQGMEGAMLAPTAMNQQKFLISYDGNHLKAKVNGRGFFAKMDLGIVKYHFECLSGHTFDD